LPLEIWPAFTLSRQPSIAVASFVTSVAPAFPLGGDLSALVVRA
jgi:hypothetical protein